MGWLPEIGDVVLGKYRVVRALGQGGMGVVFEAVNVVTDGHVALKMLKPTLDEKVERTSRMGREARSVAKLKSRFVARVMDFDLASDGGPVLVMEMLEGRDLAAELRRTSVLSVDTALSYVIQACAGVGEAHALGIIHRDLKPGNLFLDTSSGAPMVRVLDFGLAKDLASNGATDLTAPSDALGTLAYMSPEQMRATKDIGPPTDVWSLGVVLYRAIMGRLPVSEKGYAIATRLLDPRPMPLVEGDGVSRELAAVVARALEKDPTRRYADARALGSALGPFVGSPSAATKLALEELGSVPTPRANAHDARPLAEDDETTKAVATRTVVADAVAAPARASFVPPTRRERRPRHSLAGLSWETRMVLVGSAVLTVATILIAATSSPRSTRPHAPSAAAAPPELVPPAHTTAVVTALPAPRPAPPAMTSAVGTSNSSAPSMAPRSPRPRPLPPSHPRDDENPSRL